MQQRQSRGNKRDHWGFLLQRQQCGIWWEKSPSCLMGSQLLQTQLQTRRKRGRKGLFLPSAEGRQHLQLCGTRADFLKQFSAPKHRDVPVRDTKEKRQRVCRADNRGKRCWAEIAESTLKERKHNTDIFSGTKQQCWWYYAPLTPRL